MTKKNKFLIYSKLKTYLLYFQTWLDRPVFFNKKINKFFFIF